MPWFQISYRSKREFGDQISAVLEACGALAVTIKNAGTEDYFDAGLPEEPEWSEVFVGGLFERGVDPATITTSVIEQLGRGGTQLFRIDELPDQNWTQAWSRECRPTRITDRLWVCPSTTEPPKTDAVNIIIDPGLAFGTGTHPTTALCLEWLANADLSGNNVVDYGCGSGILSIAAVRLGAAHAWAIDVDPAALSATRYNAERNDVDDRISVVTDTQAQVPATDIVIANILANVIVSLEPKLAALVRPRGTILLTGILDSQVERVGGAYSGRFEFARHRRQGWNLLVGRSTECHTAK